MEITRIPWRWLGGVASLATLTLLPVFVAAQGTQSGDDGTAAIQESPAVSQADAAHRFDLGVQRLDTPVGDFETTLLGYTRVFRGNMSFSAALTVNFANAFGFTDDVITKERHIGLGDTILIYSFVPGMTVTAQPWVPRSIGFSVLLIVPTGSAEDFLGGDQFVFSPQGGWVLNIGKDFSILPAVSYARSFADGNLASPVHTAAAELGAVWAHDSGWWINYTGEFTRDLELDDWNYNDFFTVGKMFGSQIGLSLAYGVLEAIDPHARRNDQEWMLLFHYVMPNRGGKGP